MARRRLAALKEFSDLGAGFKIAALDLELRGAGNMLGGEQSGHIEAIGFEMYTSMLEEAVSKLKGEERAGVHPPRSSISASACASTRATSPKRTSACASTRRSPAHSTKRRIADVRAELEDRYGELPESVLHLLEAATLRLEVRTPGSRADRPQARPASHPFQRKSQRRPGRLMKLVAKNAKSGAQFTPQGVLRYPLAGSQAAEEVFQEIHALLDQLALEPVTA